MILAHDSWGKQFGLTNLHFFSNFSTLFAGENWAMSSSPLLYNHLIIFKRMIIIYQEVKWKQFYLFFLIVIILRNDGKWKECLADIFLQSMVSK